MSVNAGITRGRPTRAGQKAQGEGRHANEMQALTNVGGEPQYKRLARILLGKVQAREYAVGELLPTEHELCTLFGTSRHTVREALRQLEQNGVVSRRAGVGTRVLSRDSSQGYQQSLASIEDLVQFGETNIRVVKSVKKDHIMDIVTATELGCAPGSRWLQLSTVRMDAGPEVSRPICWTDVYLDPQYDSLGPIIRKSPTRLISDLIEAHFERHVVRITQTVSVSAMSITAAHALSLTPDTPALLVVRRYFDELGAMFLVTRTLHPGPQYKINMELVRTSARQTKARKRA